MPEDTEKTQPEPVVENTIESRSTIVAERLAYLEDFVRFVHSADIRKYDDMCRNRAHDKAVFAERQRVAKKAAAEKSERQRIKNAARPGKVRLEN